MKKLSYIAIALVILVSLVWLNGGCPAKSTTPPTGASPTAVEKQAMQPGSGGAGPIPTSGGNYTPAGTAPPQATPSFISDSEFVEIALAYVSQTYGVPRERLRLDPSQIEAIAFPLTGVAVKLAKVRDTLDSKSYLIAVDSDGQVRDFDKLKAAERAARWAKYGKLSQGLYELLESKGPDDLIEVLIWVAGVDPDAIARQIASKYPDARLKGISPSTETPRDLYVNVIFPEYEKALKEAHLAASRPVAEWLQSLGYEAEGSDSAPIVLAVVPKRVIAQIAAREDTVHLDREVKPKPAMDSAGPTLSAPAAWQRGITGSGVKVGIVDFGTVEPQNPYLGVQVVNAAQPEDHAAGAAGCAASLHPLYLGTAYGVSGALDNRSTNIVSAGYNGTTIYLATQAVLDAGARIVNLSWGNDNGGRWLSWDTYYDYKVRTNRVSVVAAAGNFPNLAVSSPGKGYNVITVGGIIDGNNPAWKGDSMWGSSFINSERGNEKPEVVAVAENVAPVDVKSLSNQAPWLQDFGGTSAATPQVSGGVALLFHRQPDLAYWPETVKAIVMASAIHNIAGEAQISDNDGVGAPVFGVSDAIAAVPYWVAETVNMDNDFPGGWYKNHYDFSASQGQRVRVAIAWDSEAVWNPPVEESDILKTDLDLFVYRLIDGVEVEPPVTSESGLNSFEIVDFYAPAAAIYRLKVKKVSSTEPSNYLGGAWVVVDKLWAATALGQAVQNPGDRGSAILAPVDVTSVTEPSVASSLNQEAPVPGGIEAYSGKVTYPPAPPPPTPHPPVLILDVAGGEQPFNLPPNKDIQNYQGWTTFWYDLNAPGPSPAPGDPVTLANIVIRLDGSARKAYDVYQLFESITAHETQENISGQSAIRKQYQRGDAREQFDDNAADDVDDDRQHDNDDANAIAQYLALIRPLSDLNAVNAATPQHDDPWDKITIVDALFIAQYLMGTRDEYYDRAFSAAAGVQGGTATVEISSAPLAVTGKALVPIVIKNITSAYGLGAYDLRLTFDPKVVRVDAVQPGDGSFAPPAAFNIDSARGVVLLNGFQPAIPGPSGDVVITRLALTAVSGAGSSTALDVSVVTLADSLGNDITASVADGLVTIK